MNAGMPWLSQMVVAVLMGLLGTGPVLATPYFVATNGNDGANGLGWPTAWKTFANASVNATNSGDIVTVSDGTYTVSSTIIINNGVTFKSANGHRVTIVQGSGANFTMFRALTGVILDGFAITKGIAIDSYLVQLAGATLQNCHLYGNTCDFGAIALYDGADNNVVRNCLINNNSGTYASGVYTSTVTTINTLENCTIYSNRAAFNTSQIAGGITSHNGPTHVRNCIVWGNTNTVTGGLQNWGGPYEEFSYSCTTPEPTGTGNTTNDPQVVNAPAGDYRLSSTDSPCYNTGTYRSWMAGATDLDGNSRILQGIVDMGAYEWRPPSGTVISIF